MARRIEALVKPGLLVWARQAAGLDIDIAAKKVGVTAERLTAWESGELRPTVPQLRSLARIYRRPISAFYLAEPPEEIPPPADFRRLPGEVAGVESPELRYEFRHAVALRDVALELLSEDEGEVPAFDLRAQASDPPEAVGRSMRDALGISLDVQRTWRDPYDAFNGWRSAIEELGVLVFQMRDVELREARGFSLASPPIPVIVVNIKDAPAGRVFSLMHELTHVLLRQGGLCDLDDITDRSSQALSLERYCNAAAGAALVPKEALLAEPTVDAKRHDDEWSDVELRTLASRFGVSREVVLRRLLDSRLTTTAFYARTRERFLEEYEEARRQQAVGFAPPHQMALARVGPTFTGLVLDSYERGSITASDVSDYLGVRLKHLPRIEEQLLARSRPK